MKNFTEKINLLKKSKQNIHKTNSLKEKNKDKSFYEEEILLLESLFNKIQILNKENQDLIQELSKKLENFEKLEIQLEKSYDEKHYLKEENQNLKQIIYSKDLELLELKKDIKNN